LSVNTDKPLPFSPTGISTFPLKQSYEEYGVFILSHAENAENPEFFREDARDVADTDGTQGCSRRVFRHDAQDEHDIDGT